MAYSLGDMFRLDTEDGDAVRVLSHNAEYDEYSVEVIEVVSGLYPYKGQVVQFVTPDRFLEYIPTPEPVVEERDFEDFDEDDDDDDSDEYDTPQRANASANGNTFEVVKVSDKYYSYDFEAIDNYNREERARIYEESGARNGGVFIKPRIETVTAKLYTNAQTDMNTVDRLCPAVSGWGTPNPAGVTITVDEDGLHATFETHEIKRQPDNYDEDNDTPSSAEEDSWQSEDTYLSFFVFEDGFTLGKNSSDFHYCYNEALKNFADGTPDFYEEMSNHSYVFYGKHTVDGVQYNVWSVYNED